jgi:integrase
MSIRRCTRGMLNAQGEPAFLVDYRDEHGRRKTVRTDACTLKDAQRIERDILTEIDKAKALGVPRAALSAITFASFAETVYLPWIKGEVRETTYYRYVGLVKHLTDYFGSMTLASIEPLTIDGYFQSRVNEKTHQNRPPGAGELLNRRGQLSAIMQHALKKRLIQYNPVLATDRPDYTPAPKAALTRGEEERILAAAKPWLRPIIVMGLYGGMREGEIALMRWEHIKDGLIFIPAENCKTGHARHVPISSEMEAALAPLRERRLAEGSPPWVFWNAARQAPYSPDSISSTYKRLVGKLKIKTTFHSSRVTFITDARESGKITDAVLMEITGHRTAAMLNHYTKIKPEHLIGATEGLRRGKDATQVQHEASGG